MRQQSACSGSAPRSRSARVAVVAATTVAVAVGWQAVLAREAFGFDPHGVEACVYARESHGG